MARHDRGRPRRHRATRPHYRTPLRRLENAVRMEQRDRRLRAELGIPRRQARAAGRPQRAPGQPRALLAVPARVLPRRVAGRGRRVLPALVSVLGPPAQSSGDPARSRIPCLAGPRSAQPPPARGGSAPRGDRGDVVRRHPDRRARSRRRPRPPDGAAQDLGPVLQGRDHPPQRAGPAVAPAATPRGRASRACW